MTTLTVQKELKITGEEDQLKAFVKEFDTSLPSSWTKLPNERFGAGSIEMHVYLKSDFGKAGLKVVVWRKPSYQL